MKVFLSSDMEGTAGVVDWDQCVGDGPEDLGAQLELVEPRPRGVMVSLNVESDSGVHARSASGRPGSLPTQQLTGTIEEGKEARPSRGICWAPKPRATRRGRGNDPAR